MQMVADLGSETVSEWEAMGRVADLLGVGTAETVRKWVRRFRCSNTPPTPRNPAARHLPMFRGEKTTNLRMMSAVPCGHARVAPR
ncbi:hypothetical protein MSAR_08110 [Mycolicibacterium sarraceniae]|uniref:Transposase n=1 Tax=Mycolicibacterium sarraceniae TaxID=1534348 RepID=A0A7I7SNR5_9MYCO|nr:hypothetical protein MSAR_08110 [Mycolicibacterium sarraceniae]